VFFKLARYTEHELADMGIARGDIVRLSYAEAGRRVGMTAPPIAAYGPELKLAAG